MLMSFHPVAFKVFHEQMWSTAAFLRHISPLTSPTKSFTCKYRTIVSTRKGLLCNVLDSVLLNCLENAILFQHAPRASTTVTLHRSSNFLYDSLRIILFQTTYYPIHSPPSQFTASTARPAVSPNLEILKKYPNCRDFTVLLIAH